MADLGDLREGFWDREEMVETCVHVERELPHVHLRGVGVNLSCYGSIRPTPEKMNELIDIAREVERRIGRPLETVSGGATSSYTLVHSGAMPEGINHLRIGENILLAKDLQIDWGIRGMDYLQMDAFTLRAEIIELRRKPPIRRGSSPSTPSATSRSIPTGASVCGRSSRSAAPTWVSWSRCAPCSRASVWWAARPTTVSSTWRTVPCRCGSEM